MRKTSLGCGFDHREKLLRVQLSSSAREGDEHHEKTFARPVKNVHLRLARLSGVQESEEECGDEQWNSVE